MAMFGMDNDKKTQLVQEVYRRPLIWKVTDPRYSDIPARWLAFEEIAHELSDDNLVFTSDMIKVAWKNMMDYYNQIRRRHDRAAAAGVEPPDSKWQFFSLMHFTRQDKPPVKRRYNWMEPSKLQISANYGSSYANNAVSLRAKTKYARCTATRTKESEKARIRARREALRDSNVTQSSASPVANGTFIGTRMGNKISYDRTRAATRTEMVSTLTETNETNGTYSETDGCQEVVKSALSFHPNGTQQKDICLPEFSSTSELSKCHSNIPSKSPISQEVNKQHNGVDGQSVRRQPINGVGSSLVFGEHVATRLYKIKEKSLGDFYRICDALEKLLDDAETALDIVDTDIIIIE
ncbi:unnamed protein product [Thelazia callipaeda]|uniref:MADF domain-containing protein n=1 Tax=Thelazia callipaeda TaxID=103827 RepID=A0A0N5CXR5_THECL|nr:unnamed protein product [Thelazia callipaeda]